MLSKMSANKQKYFLPYKIIFILFILGFATASFTYIRFTLVPVGISETLISCAILLLIIINFFSNKIFIKIKCNNIFIYYWLIFFVFLFAGFLYSKHIQIKGAIVFHNLFAYFYVGTVSVILSSLNDNLNKCCLWISIITVALMIPFSFCDQVITFVDARRFSGFANNPNQLALAFLLTPFLLLYFIFTYKDLHKYFRYVLFFLSVWALCVTFKIRTMAALLADFVILYLAVVWLIYKNINTKKAKIIFISSICSINLSALVFLVLFFNKIYMYILGVHMGEWNIRMQCWTEAWRLFKTGWLTGFGPGSFIYGTTEAHNTFIDAALQTGIVGLILYCTLIITIFARLILQNKIFLAILLIGLIIFSCFHFILRQPIVWFYLVWFYFNAHQSTVSRTSNNTYYNY